MVAMVRCRKRLGIGVSGPGTARVPTGASHVHQPLSNNRASRPPNPAFGPIAPDNEVLSGPQRPLFSPRGSNLPYPLSAKRRLPRARRDGGLFRMRRHPLHVGLTVTSSSALT